MNPATTTETQLERQVREEQEAHEAIVGSDNVLDAIADALDSTDGEHEQEDGAPIVEGSGQAVAFDRTQYELEGLQIPSVDGQAIDKIRVDFAGSVMLNRSDEADVALINRLRLGGECELRVAGTVSGVKTGYTTSKDGDLDAVVLGKTVKVATVWVLSPEQL